MASRLLIHGKRASVLAECEVSWGHSSGLWIFGKCKNSLPFPGFELDFSDSRACNEYYVTNIPHHTVTAEVSYTSIRVPPFWSCLPRMRL